MNFILMAKPHFVCYLSIGLLSLSLLTECEKVRLVGPSRCSGRVELYYNGRWGTVCDDQWGTANADVACREVNCGTALEAKRGAFFGEGKDDIWLDDVQCTGREPSILKCQHRPFGENNCGHSEDAGVVCLEHLKIMNGSNRCNGRVEIYHDGHWKRICNSDWGKEQGDVLCRELKCGTPTAPTEELNFGSATNLVGVKATCTGNESSISLCKIQDFKENCLDASIVCTNSKPIRLMNGTNRCSGRVEIFYDGQWGTVCDDRWGMQEAAVTCREMSCGTALAVKYKAYFGRGSDQVWLDDLQCTGREKTLSDCPHRAYGEHDCDHSEDAGVVCSESIRLYNGTDRCSGALEFFQNNQWRKVCNHNWGHEQASLVCKELDCGTPKKLQDNVSFGDRGLSGCTSTCSGNVKSFSECTCEENRGRCDGVSLSCSGNPPLRLVNGTDRCSGRLEVLHDGLWGTVCDDEWDIKDAQVVCNALDCGSPLAAKSGAFFGQGVEGIWLDDVRCYGNETSILHCQHSTLGESNCGHAEDAGVVCSATIRLLNGTDQCSGRVQLSRGDHWASTHNVNWGMNEATVVCRELGCGDPVKASGSFGQGTETRGYKVSCSGRENSLSQCTLRESSSTGHDRIEEASVQCSGNVKLMNGPNRCAGRVEYYDKGRWGPLCGEAWDMNDATVVCRQLDCGRPDKITTSTEYGQGAEPTWEEQIECSSSESTMAECLHRRSSDKPCNATSIAGVVCTGSLEVRLANSMDECSGRVEVRHGETWQTVCDTDWNLRKAQVVCDVLQCGAALQIPGNAHFGQGTGSVVEASDSCFNNLTFIQQCSITGFQSSRCGHEQDASVLCAAQIRLVDGTGLCSGRVEVFYKNLWGTVCDDDWLLSGADVVCRQLGCGHAVSAPMSAHFGRGTGPIWMDNVECTGQESAITHCRHNGFGKNNCGHAEDAGVICLGALLKPQITLSPAPEVNWGDKVEITCTVVTQHLGGTFILKKTQGSFRIEKYSENEAATFVFPAVDFSQKGSYICEYQKKLPNQVIHYPQGNPADLSVIVRLEIPSISLSSPHAMVVYSPDAISVSQGNGFSITCSIHSRYNGGYFYLTKSNVTVTEAKLAFGHTIFYLAKFDFPAIEYKDQGVYHCVYGINISSRSFCSEPSKSLQLTVVAPINSSSVVSGVVVGMVVLLLVLVIGYLVWRRRRQGGGTVVQFSNSFGGTIKEDIDERSNQTFEESDRNTQMKEHRQGLKDKKADAEVDNPAERDPEDLAGRVCYEFEPLVLS